MKSIAQSFHSTPEESTQKKIGSYLAMVNYHANPITSGMFITATALNPLVVDLVHKANGGDIQLSWTTTWAVAMFIPGILCLILMPIVIYPPDVKVTPDAKNFAKENLKEMGHVSTQEKIMLGVFALMLLLSANIPVLIFGEQWSVDATTTTFIGLTTLILTGVLTWDYILKEKSAWDIIIWFGALIMMASYLNKLGLISWFSSNIENMIGMTSVGWVGAVAILTLVYLYIHYFFASTTAHITALFAALFAAFCAVGLSFGAPPMLYALILAAASNIMMTLTHYATGTAPVIFNSGCVTLVE